MEKVELSQLKYLGMREELISYLQGLSDKNYQYQAWVEDKKPNGGHDELDYAVHFLFDDTSLAEDPSSMIGWILIDSKESDAILNVTRALDNIFDKYGLNLTDKEYIAKEEWKRVIDAANKARKIMLSNK